MKSVHRSVLSNEVIQGLSIKKNDTVFDGTLGGFGHGRAICQELGTGGTYVGVDEDIEAIRRAEEVMENIPHRPHVFFKQGNFRDLRSILDQIDMQAIDKVLFDLGLSSDELENSGRGFSFKRNEPLLMTYKVDPDPEKDMTAQQVINHFDGKTLYTIIRNYGEERFAKRIVAGILEERTEKPIKTTGELVRIIEKSTPVRYRKQKIHPATRVFQALRMTVNDEFTALKEGIEAATEKLSPGGRIAIISFESTSDRLVKNFFKERERDGILTLLTKRPIVPGNVERAQNSRSRSAKLRIAEKKETI